MIELKKPFSGSTFSGAEKCDFAFPDPDNRTAEEACAQDREKVIRWLGNWRPRAAGHPGGFLRVEALEPPLWIIIGPAQAGAHIATVNKNLKEGGAASYFWRSIESPRAIVAPKAVKQLPSDEDSELRRSVMQILIDLVAQETITTAPASEITWDWWRPWDIAEAARAIRIANAGKVSLSSRFTDGC